MCLYSRKSLFTTLVLWTLGSINIFAQCPIVTSPTQTFCDIQTPIVGNLLATNVGNGVRWYATANSAVPLSPAAGLINGEDYYADDNTGTCGARPRVDVVIYGQPMGLSFQGVCVDDPLEATISDLIASGNDVRWYLVSNGGVALSPTTVLNDNTIYYADQANPTTGCRTSRLSVFVNVGVVPVPVGNAIQEFCFDQQPAPTVADLVASGTTNNWYNTISSALPLDPSTPLVDGANYYATTVDPPCESIERLEVLVIFNQPNDPGTDGTIEVCEPDITPTQTVNLFDGLNGTPMTGGTWTGPLPTSNGSTGTVNISTMTSIGSPYVFSYTVDASPGCAATTATVSVIIITPQNPGTNGAVTFCGNGTPTDLFDSLGGTPDAGGAWSPALTSGTGLFDPNVDAAGVYTYTITGIPPCMDVMATVTVTLTPPPNPGTNSAVPFCGNETPTDLFNSLGGTPEAGGTWSPALSSGTGLFDPNLDPAGIYTYTVVGTPPCLDATATVTVTLTPPPNAGTNGAVNFCGNGTTTDLFDSLGGTPETGGTWSPALSSGTGLFDPNLDPAGVYTYTIAGTPPCLDATATVTVTLTPPPNAGTNGAVTFCDTGIPTDLFVSLGGAPETGGTWSPALSSGTGLFDPNLDPAGVYTYTIIGTPPCLDATATVTVTIAPPPNAGTNGAVNFCGNGAPTDLFDSLGGTPETGGTWSPALSSGTGLFDPNLDSAGVYTYTVTGTPPCLDAIATVTVTLTPPPNAGTNGAVTFCDTGIPTDLFDSLGGTPETGGTWSPALASGTGFFDPDLDPAGVYTYTIIGTPPCLDATANVTVTLTPPPNAGTNGAVNFCENGTPTDLFDSLGGTPEADGTWSPALSSGTGLFDPNLDPAGVYTYTVTGTPPCLDATATVTVTLTAPPNAGANGAITFCENGTPLDLFTILNGTPETGGTWSPPLASGTGSFDPDLDPAGVYTYTIIGTPPCLDATATVTVTIAPPPNAGISSAVNICENGTPINLFDSLGGTPDPDGFWQPQLASGTGIFDPFVDIAGTYMYVVTGISPCEDATAEVMVTLSPPPNAGSDETVTFCGNATPIDLFTILGGTPEVGGTWNPSLASGTGFFDPAIDSAGTYTYIVVGTPPCTDAMANVTITIATPPNAGTSSTVAICENGIPVNLFDSLGGTPDTNGSWQPQLASGTGVFDPLVDSAGTYTYIVTGIPPCGNATAEIIVALIPAPNAGTNGSIVLCETGFPVNLFDSLNGSPEIGGTWTPPLTSGTGVFDPLTDAAGTYTYMLTGANSCTATSTVTVSLVPVPNAGTDGTITVCSNDAQIDLFNSLTGTPDAGGTWTPALASGSGLFDPSLDMAGEYTYTMNAIAPCRGTSTATVTVTINEEPDTTGAIITATSICIGSDATVRITGATLLMDGTYTIFYDLSGANVSTNNSINTDFTGGVSSFTIPETLLTTSGSTTTTITQLTSTTTTCNGDVSTIPSAVFDVYDAPTPTLITGGNSFCSEDNPTIQDLTLNIIETSNITWYDAPTNGNAYQPTEALVDGITYYASLTTVEGCPSLARLAVTVILNTCQPLVLIIPDGFSPNDDGTNDTFNIVNIRQLYPDFTVEIYNRYGNVLYKGNRDIPNWDGTSKESSSFGNSQVPVGVYFYILEFNDGSREPIQGRVYLSR
ncbi:MAG: gliding motility-associated C-terminal domain-containing protein [Aquaticitalea sp.]